MALLAAFAALWLLQAVAVAAALLICFLRSGAPGLPHFWHVRQRFAHRPNAAHNAR